MKILKQFKKVSIMLIMFLFMASSSFAATWFVNATNGDDLNFDGTSSVTPFRTIAAAMTAASDDDVISIATDFYTENVTVTKDLTFVTTAFKGLTKATITGNLDINAVTAGTTTGVVSIGEGASLGFDFTGTFDLTDGALSILSANLQFSAATVTVTVVDGTINNTPTYDNIVDVDYVTGSDRSSGPELPGDLNGGTLTNNLAAGDVLTITTAVIIDMYMNVAGADAIFNNTLLVETSTFNNIAGGDVTFKGLATFKSDMNNGADDLVFEAGFVVDAADINNNNAGVVDAQANSSIEDGDINNTGTIQLNSNTLAWTSDNGGIGALTLTNSAAGAEIISDAPMTVGAGTIVFAGDDDFLIEGELPNLSIPNAYTGNGAGVVVAVAGIDVYGNLTLDAAAVTSLDDGGNGINMYGDFLRTNDTPKNFVATGVLSFLGKVDQTFNPGASLTIANLVVDNTASAVVNMAASISINNNVTINTANAATTGNLELDTYNIRMLGAAVFPNATFTNNGSYLSTATTGYLIFESGGVNTLTGDGDFNNIDIRNASTVTYTSDINFSGILNLRDASLSSAGGVVFNLDDEFVTIPSINVWTDLATFVAAPADVDISAGVLYDLTYLAAGGAYAAGGEWSLNIAPSINNLSVNTTGGAVVTGTAVPSTIAGVLDVDGTETVNLAADVATLVGPGVNHTVDGEVMNGELVVQGDGSSITGSDAVANLSSIEDWTVDLASMAETFTSTGIRNITGDLTHNDGTSNIMLSDDDVVAPGTTGPAFLGNLDLVDGELTFGMTANGSTILGTSTLTDGELILASDIDVASATTQLDADLTIGTWDYEANAVYTHGAAATTPGLVTGTTGFLVLNYVGAFDLIDDLQVTNLEIQNNITQTTGDLEVTNEWLSTAGTYNLVAQDVLLSGSIFNFEGGAFAATTGVYKFTGTTATLDVDLTMVNVEFDNTTNGMTFVDGTPLNAPPTWTITGDMVQTSGDVSMDDVDFIVDGGTFTRVAGAWTSTTAFFIFRNAPAIAQGTGWTVDRLAVDGAGALTADKAFTVNTYLRLAMSLDANDPALSTAPWNLTLGDAATIERQDNLATLVEKANYGATVNLYYTTDVGGITTISEASSSAIDEFKVEVPVALDRDIMVNGTLVLDARNGVANGMVNDAGFDLGMAGGSLVTLVDVGGAVALPGGLLDPQGTLNVYYDNATAGAIATSNNELSTTFTLGNVTVDGALAANEVQLHANHTVNGTLLINDDGDFNIVDNTLTLAGAYTASSNGEITNAAPGVATGAVLFGGATSSDITLSQDWTIPVGVPDYTLGINTTTPDVVKTVKGADLDFEANGADLKLMSGVFATDPNTASPTYIILRHTDDGAQPVQGFTRTGDSHVDGNLKKYLDATGTRYTRTAAQVATSLTSVEFPNGSSTAPSRYRPMELQFSDIPTAGTWITVNHSDVKPNGTNGMPLTTGEGFTITNFSEFYWTLTSDINIQTTTNYHVVASAEGYEDQYTSSEVENIRFVRRKAGNDNNAWVLQGASGYDNSTEDAAVLPAIFPITSKVNVVAKDAEGAIRSEGAVFAYSQSNQAPHFTAELVNPTNVLEGATVAQTYTIADNDVTNQDLSMFAVTLPDGATFDPATGDFEFVTDNYSSVNSPYTVKIGATDGLDTSYATATINVADVNSGVAWVTNPATANVAEGVLNTIQYTAETPDSEKTVVYAIVNNGGALTLAIDAATGAVTYTPAAIEVGTVYNVTISADDQAGVANSVVQQVTALTVVETNDAPVLTPATVDTTINEGQALALAFAATDPELGVITFTLGAAAPATATIDPANGDVAWTPAYTDAGVHAFNVIATDDGTPNMNDSSLVTITVVDQNAPPTWVTVLPDTTILVGDVLTFTYVAEDLDLDVLEFSLDVPNPETLVISGTTDNTVTIQWTPVVIDTALYIIGMNATDGTNPAIRTEARVTVKVITVDVSGVIDYSVSGELLDAVTVTLSNGTDTMTDITDATGAYAFTGVMAGEYTLVAAKTTQWGGAKASDALVTDQYTSDPTKLPTDLQKLAADVVILGSVSPADANAILWASVGVKNFEVADWIFEDVVPFTVGTSNVSQNISGIAAGDAQSNYSPATGLGKALPMAINNADVLNIKKESEFELPISISELAELGSYTFKLKYAADKVEFLGASTSNGGMLVSNVVDDVISVAWLNSKEVKVEEGGSLVSLKFKATEAFVKGDEVSVELLSGSEMTDRMAKNINAGINIPVVAIAIPDVFALRQNYPNPFNPSTTIQYDLPENGKVTLTIYNSLGQTVGTLVNAKQVAGAYDVKFNASNLASGVYLYRVTVEGTKNFVMTKKMILMK